MEAISIIIIVVTATLISQSGTTRKEWIKENCNKEAAFKIGQRDYKHGRDNDPIALKDKCPESNLKLSLEGYETGYAAAKKAQPDLHNYKSGQDLIEDIFHDPKNDIKPKSEN